MGKEISCVIRTDFYFPVYRTAGGMNRERNELRWEKTVIL